MKKGLRNIKFLILIPARSGSKGIKNKNIIKVGGKPLIEYTITFANSLKLDTEVVVSTDSKKIANISKKAGASCPTLRPKKISSDLIGDMPVVRHALIEREKSSLKRFDYVIMLQPTSPIRFKNQIYKAISHISKNNFDSLIAISLVDKKYHPYKQFGVISNKIQPFSEKSIKIVARQQLSNSYIRNGIVYIFSRSFALNSTSVYSSNSGYIIINEPFVNIDTPKDLLEFEKYLKSKNEL